MNPQGNNNQQAPDDQAAPAGPWNAGIQINIAPPPLVMAAAQPTPPAWREQCRDAGYSAGDESIGPYLNGQVLMEDNGDYNWTLINEMSNRRGAPEGLRMALITMVFLLGRRNGDLESQWRLRRKIEAFNVEVLNARAHLLKSMIDGLRGDPLERLRRAYLAMRQRMVDMQAELHAIEAETDDHHGELMIAERHLFTMFRGQVPFRPLVDVEAYTERGNVVVFRGPWPKDMLTLLGERWVPRFPVSAMVCAMCLMGTPLMLLHPVNRNTPDRPALWESTMLASAMFATLFILFARVIDLLFFNRRRH